MLLTVSTTFTPATDLGYLLAKNPARLHTFDLAFGKVLVFYPEASAERCTAALLLDVDPVGLAITRSRMVASVSPGDVFGRIIRNARFIASYMSASTRLTCPGWFTFSIAIFAVLFGATPDALVWRPHSVGS
jgi:hypothetical protein